MNNSVAIMEERMPLKGIAMQLLVFNRSFIQRA